MTRLSKVLFILFILMLFPVLRMEASAGLPVPGGSYQRTCHDIHRRGNFVSATCASEVWGDKSADIDLRRCARNATGLTNLNGSLVCEGPLPSGSYQETCHGIFVMDRRLHATCKTKGGWGDYRVNAVEFASCTEGFRNDDGRLRCGQ